MGLLIRPFQCNMLQENCYVVSDATGECVVIDCGAFYEAERQAIVKYIEDEHLKPVHSLLTHGHLDHCFGVDLLHEHYGLLPEMNEGDAKLYETLDRQAEAFYQMKLDRSFPAPAATSLEHEDKITFGTHTLQVIATPGHSRGSVCFFCPEEQVLFSGDTLFRSSIGRTDFPGGNRFLIIQSLRHLAMLPDQTRVLPGHGPETTMGYELSHNPYMDR